MDSTYTQAHRKSYEKRKTFELQRMSVYYQKNKEYLKAKRRARYAAQKEIKALAISV